MSLASNYMGAPWCTEKTINRHNIRNPQGTLECNRIGEAYVDDTEM